MKTWKVLSLIAVVAIVAAGCGSGGSGKTLVEINGSKITDEDIKFLGEINPRIQAQLQSPAAKQRVIDNLVEQELLYQDALKEGVNRDSAVKAKIELYRRVIIAQSLLEKEADKAAKKFYDDNSNDFKKLKFSNILVKFTTPEQQKAAKGSKEQTRSEEAALKIANELKAKIDGGADFAAVAKESSDDFMTKANGGDMGLSSKDDKRLTSRGYAPLLDKAFEMKVGEVYGPIKTSDGYHIITVTKAAEVVPFEEAKQEILFKVRNDSRTELLAKLKKNAKIIYPEEEAKKAEAEKKAREMAKAKPEATPEAPEATPAPTAAPDAAPAEDAAPAPAPTEEKK